MMEYFDGLTLELVPHCASVSPDGWTGDHDDRPLTDLGRRQARSLVPALGTGMDGIYSSPALRCLQTVRPLARAAGLPVTELGELLDTRGFAEPRQWTNGDFRSIAEAVSGGWAAGHGLRALTAMARRHPRGRVTAASHGDIIPAFLAMLCAASDVALPGWPGRGGWYTLLFTAGSFTVQANRPDPGSG